MEDGYPKFDNKGANNIVTLRVPRFSNYPTTSSRCVCQDSQTTPSTTPQSRRAIRADPVHVKPPSWPHSRLWYASSRKPDVIVEHNPRFATDPVYTRDIVN